MALIRDGLTTEMNYAVVSSAVDFGTRSDYHGEDKGFWGMLKPPFEAWKIVEVMRTWGTTVYPVSADPRITEVAGAQCYRSLSELPGPVDCVVVSLPDKQAMQILDDVVAAHVPIVWLQYGAAKAHIIDTYHARGVHTVSGCVLLHWDVQNVSGSAKGRHICYMHGNLEHVARIRVNPDGSATRIEPIKPETLPFNSETYGTRILLPIWPKHANDNTGS
jgi:predicted CoA-binding protein